MEKNYLNPNTNHSDALESAFFIKFGSRFYKVLESQIAYIYKGEGIMFIVDINDQKFPVSGIDLDDLYLSLDSNCFFRISPNLIVHRKSVSAYDYESRSVLLSQHKNLDPLVKVSFSQNEHLNHWLLNQKKTPHHEKSNVRMLDC